MNPIAIIATGTVITIIGAVIAGYGTYKQNLSSSQKSTKILELGEENKELSLRNIELSKENITVAKESRDSLTKHFNQELANFGIIYNEGQERFEKLIITTGTPIPTLAINQVANGVEIISRNDESIVYRIHFHSYQATAHNVHLLIKTMFGANTNGFMGAPEPIEIGPGQTFIIGTDYSFDVTVNQIDNSFAFDRLYIRIEGSYSDVDKIRTQSADILVEYRFKTSKWGEVVGKRRADILERYESNAKHYRRTKKM
ncbi:MAG TPA: hypothetical protein VIM65_04915 [Cyclobacteriaceae bacterium]